MYTIKGKIIGMRAGVGASGKPYRSLYVTYGTDAVTGLAADTLWDYEPETARALGDIVTFARYRDPASGRYHAQMFSEQ